MGEDAVEAEAGLTLEPVKEGVEMLSGGDALTSHASVDFQVNGIRFEVASVLVDRGGEGFELMLFPGDGNEPVVNDGGGFFRESSAHDEDARLILGCFIDCFEGFADRCAFCGVGHA